MRDEKRHNLCKKCGVWSLAEDDIYCSYCGEPVAKLELSIPNNVVYFGDSGASGELTLHLINSGQTTIRVESISIEHDWVKIPDWLGEVIEIPAGNVRDISIKVDLKGPCGRYSCDILLQTKVGTQKISIEVLPRPRFLLSIDGLISRDTKGNISAEPMELSGDQPEQSPYERPFILKDDLKEEVWKCCLEIYDSKATVESLDLTSDLPFIRISECPPLPFSMDSIGIRTLEFTMEVSPISLPQGDYTCTVSATCSGIAQPFTGKFMVICRAEPRIEFLQASNAVINLPTDILVRKEDDIEDIAISVRNSGGLAVEISGVQIKEGWLEPAFELPITLEPAHIEQLRFRAFVGKFLPKLRETSAPSLPLKEKLLFSFRCVRYPDYKLSDAEIEVNANVAIMPEYEGIIAIDFGTTNSCCAIESGVWTQPTKMIPLGMEEGEAQEGRIRGTFDIHQASLLQEVPGQLFGEEQAILPSAIYYKNQRDGQLDYIVGRRALTFSMMPATNPSTVRSVKRRLGQKERIQVRLDESKQIVTFLPEEVTGHIVRHIIDFSERYLKRRITKCVITHPARFFRPQIMALERAFEQECGVKVVALVNEAVAAAVDAILEQKTSQKNEYTALVYDFGGGTTDIALLRVKDFLGEDGIREVVPEILGVDGKRRLGGDDVTERLVGLIYRKCLDELRQLGDADLLWDVDSSADTPARDAANANRVTLLTAAEEHKKRLASGGEPRLPPITLACMSDNEIKPYVFVIDITEEEMNATIEDDIRNALLLAQELIRIANERDNLNINHPDIVVLAGMSSRLPIVKRLAEEVFPNSDVRLHPDLKACVARGAYRIHAISVEPSMVLLDTSMLKAPPPTSAQYGIMVHGIHGELIFKAAIPKGARLPAEGFISGFRIGRQTAITVYENPGASMSDPEIRKIAVCRLNIPDSISEQALRSAKVFMRLEDEMNLKIVLRVGDESFQFSAEVEPYI